MVFKAPLVAVSLLVAASSPAAAHHVVTDANIAPVMPNTVAAVDLGLAGFDFADQHGAWQTVTPSLEWRLGRRTSIFGALPLARVKGRHAVANLGLGDLALSGKVALYASPHGGLLLSAGLGLELPTGRSESGLGSGHMELEPFVVAASTLGHLGATEVIIHGVGSGRFSLGGSDSPAHSHPADETHAHAHGSVLAPHQDRELFGRFALAGVGRRLDGGLGLEAAGTPGAEDGAYLAGRIDLGFRLTDTVRVFAGLDRPLWGQRRFTVRGRAGVAWRM